MIFLYELDKLIYNPPASTRGQFSQTLSQNKKGQNVAQWCSTCLAANARPYFQSPVTLNQKKRSLYNKFLNLINVNQGPARQLGRLSTCLGKHKYQGSVPGTTYHASPVPKCTEPGGETKTWWYPIAEEAKNRITMSPNCIRRPCTKYV